MGDENKVSYPKRLTALTFVLTICMASTMAVTAEIPAQQSTARSSVAQENQLDQEERARVHSLLIQIDDGLRPSAHLDAAQFVDFSGGNIVASNKVGRHRTP